MHFLLGVALGVGAAVLWFTLTVHLAHLLGLGYPRPHRHLLRKLHHHLVVALCCAVAAGVIAGAGAVTGYQVLYGPKGVLEPPSVAQRAYGAPSSHGRHGLGFVPQRGWRGGPRTLGVTHLPAAVDLSGDAPPVGDQGPLASCGSWAVGYGLASYNATRSGHPLPQGGAAMFLYSQASGGLDEGTTLPAVLRILVRQGIDARAHYRQGDYNYRALPTASERRNAARWRSAGWHSLFIGDHQGVWAEQSIRQAIAAGHPVAIGVPVYNNMLAATASSYYITRPSGQNWGGHAMVAYRYDSNGVWVMSSWGVGWGLNGWVELGYGFLDRYALEADTLTPR